VRVSHNQDMRQQDAFADATRVGVDAGCPALGIGPVLVWSYLLAGREGDAQRPARPGERVQEQLIGEVKGHGRLVRRVLCASPIASFASFRDIP
jgi:hypothetical protein